MYTKRTTLLPLLLAAFAICAIVGLSFPSVSYALDGDGTTANPYRIADGDDLLAFANEVQANPGQETHAVLTNDITMGTFSGGTYTPASSSYPTEWTPINQFEGTFDGQGHTIGGLNVNGVGEGYSAVGLFGDDNGDNGSISNLTIANSTFIGNQSVGAIAGSINGDVSIVNCRSIENTISGNGMVGGIVGVAYGSGMGSRIENCYNDSTVSILGEGGFAIGGIVGRLYYGSVQNSWNAGSITAQNTPTSANSIGGIIGFCVPSSDPIEGLCNTGTISVPGADGVGGIFGYGFADAIRNAYNTGDITAAFSVSGIGSESSDASNCFNVGRIIASDDPSTAYGLFQSEPLTANNLFWLDGSADRSVGYGTPIAASPASAFETKGAGGIFDSLRASDPQVWNANLGIDGTEQSQHDVWLHPILSYQHAVIDAQITLLNGDDGATATAANGRLFASASLANGDAIYAYEGSSAHITATPDAGYTVSVLYDGQAIRPDSGTNDQFTLPIASAAPTPHQVVVVYVPEMAIIRTINVHNPLTGDIDVIRQIATLGYTATGYTAPPPEPEPTPSPTPSPAPTSDPEAASESAPADGVDGNGVPAGVEGTWSTDMWAAFAAPQFDGYEPNPEQIDAQNVDWTTQDTTVDITYSKIDVPSADNGTDSGESDAGYLASTSDSIAPIATIVVIAGIVAAIAIVVALVHMHRKK